MHRFEITKSGERIVPENETALWAGLDPTKVMASEEDVLGNQILERGQDPSYREVFRSPIPL